MGDEVPLRDGSALAVRPIRPGDAPALVALHARLSADTVYRRYFGARPHLAPTVVDRFTRVAEPWRFALVAVRDDRDLVAVARYEHTGDGPTVELAMVVDDALQRSGIGRILLGRLLDVAVLRGVRTLVADVLPGNAPMLRLLRSTGHPVRSRSEDGYLHLQADLTGHAPDAAAAAVAWAHIAAAAEVAAAAAVDQVGR